MGLELCPSMSTAQILDPMPMELATENEQQVGWGVVVLYNVLLHAQLAQELVRVHVSLAIKMRLCQPLVYDSVVVGGVESIDRIIMLI